MRNFVAGDGELDLCGVATSAGFRSRFAGGRRNFQEIKGSYGFQISLLQKQAMYYYCPPPRQDGLVSGRENLNQIQISNH